MKTERARCSGCGATLKLKAGSNYITCEYCGTINIISREIPEKHSEKSLCLIKFDEGSIDLLSSLKEWAFEKISNKKDDGSFSLIYKELIYIPIYIFNVFTKTFWEGYSTRKTSLLDFMNKRTGQDRNLYWQGVFASYLDFPHTDNIKYEPDAFEKIETNELEGLNCLPIEKDFETAWEEAQNFIYWRERKRTRRFLPRLVYSETNFKLKESFLGYIPIILLKYTHKSKTYHVVYNCSTEDFNGERPKKSHFKSCLIALIVVGFVLITCVITTVIISILN
jgi:LSD1 subclass zinc finger protein